MAVIRELTADPGRELHASIAGGRKSPGRPAGPFDVAVRPARRPPQPRDRRRRLRQPPGFLLSAAEHPRSIAGRGGEALDTADAAFASRTFPFRACGRGCQGDFRGRPLRRGDPGRPAGARSPSPWPSRPASRRGVDRRPPPAPHPGNVRLARRSGLGPALRVAPGAAPQSRLARRSSRAGGPPARLCLGRSTANTWSNGPRGSTSLYGIPIRCCLMSNWWRAWGGGRTPAIA